MDDTISDEDDFDLETFKNNKFLSENNKALSLAEEEQL
jgi:hypothetical protein